MTRMEIGSSSSARDSSEARKDWVVFIQDGLNKHAQNKRPRPKPENIMRRVRRNLRELKPEHYAASDFSFGLFDRSSLNGQQAIGEKCKLLYASAVLRAMGLTEDDWEQFCEHVVPDPKETQDMYDELERESLSLREVQSVLTLDAVFLACVLGLYFDSGFATPFFRVLDTPSIIDSYTDERIATELLPDLFKVENQVPLSLIHTVLLSLWRAFSQHRSTSDDVISMELETNKTLEEVVSAHAEETLRMICVLAVGMAGLAYLPGFDFGHYNTSIRSVGADRTWFPFVKCNNLLDCLYRWTCEGWDPSLEDEPSSMIPKETTLPWSTEVIQGLLPVPLPSVSELRKAGIKFQGCKGHFHRIEFKEQLLKGTLHLPMIVVDESSEEFWRNLVAYEDILWRSKEKPKYYKHAFTNYLDFMDRLIDDSNDVMLLKSTNPPTILAQGLGTDEAVAHIFNSTVIQNCLVGEIEGSDKWKQLHRQLYDFYNQSYRRPYVDFMETYCGTPWVVISLITGFILLTLTVLQTYYTIYPNPESQPYGEI